MKNIFRTSKGIILILLIFLLGCQKDYLNVNTDPNNPANSTVQLTFPAGVGSEELTVFIGMVAFEMRIVIINKIE